MTWPGRRLRAAVLAGVLALALVACGSVGRDPDAGLRAGPGTGEPSDAVAVRSAAAATIAAGGADITVAGQGPARGRLVQTTGEGDVELAGRGTRLDLAIDAIGPVRARIRGDEAYAALPAGAVGELARGRSWVSVDLREADAGLYADTVVQLGTGVTGNPADIPTVLSTVADRDAVLVGPDVVAGTPATRYRVTLDLARVAAAHPDLASVLDRYRADTGVAGLPTASLPVEVWVGPDGRLVRVAQLLGGSAAVSTVTFTATGPRPRVVEPEADRVTDLLATSAN